MTETYGLSNSVRNLLYSIIVTLVAWNIVWLAWTTAIPGPPPAARPGSTVISYTRRSGGADGAPWSPLLIILPFKAGLSDKVGEQDPRVVAFLQPRLMAPEYLEGFPGEAPKSGGNGAEEWALAGARGAGRYVPAQVEPQVYTGARGRSGKVEVALLDGLRDSGFRTGVAWEQALGKAADKAVLVTARVETGLQGQVSHVFIENSSGFPEVDRAVLKVLYSGRVTNTYAGAAGRVRVNLAGGSGS